MARTGGTSFAPLDRPEPDEFESRVKVWIAPDRAREERDDPERAGFGVQRGDAFWHYDDIDGARGNEGRPDVVSGIGEELRSLFDLGADIGVLDFGRPKPSRWAGRDTLSVRAVPRGGERQDFMRYGTGADELLLDIDAERGVVLRVECRLDGEPYAITEALEVAFDETFPEDTFVFTPPPGEKVRSIVEEPHVRPFLSIEQAVALAPFTVWIPSRVPRDWESNIAFAAGGAAPQVFLHYGAMDGTHRFTIGQSPEDHPDDHHEYDYARAGPWRDAERDGRRMEVREQLEDWHPAQVRLELDGTRIFIHSSDLEPGALVDVAAGLKRAPSAPPALGAA